MIFKYFRAAIDRGLERWEQKKKDKERKRAAREALERLREKYQELRDLKKGL